jgi:hypothetical protein
MSLIAYSVRRWMPLWRYGPQQNETGQIQGPFQQTAFLTRRECRAYIQKTWGYIKTRPDLRGAPHHWRLPVPILVEIRITPA